MNRIILKIGINPCQLNEKPKTKASCIRNLKEILKLLLNQKYVNRSEMLWFDEETIFEATKYKIVEFLLTLKKNYEKKNKEKFQKIESPEHFFDRLLRIYVLKNKERKKMLVYPKYIDDDHF